MTLDFVKDPKWLLKLAALVNKHHNLKKTFRKQ